MKAIKNKQGKVLSTTRELRVNYTQLKRLIEDLNIEKIPLIHPALDIVFRVDLDEFMDFQEYYKNFIFTVDVTNHFCRDTSYRSFYSLDLTGAKNLYKG